MKVRDKMGKEIRDFLEKNENCTKIRDDLFLIQSPELPSSNSLLILGNSNILIDTGTDKEILNKIKSEIDKVLLSHYHFDHIKNNKLFKNVKITKMEAPALKGPENYLKMCGVNDPEIKERMMNQLEENPQFENIWRDKVETYSINQTIKPGQKVWQTIHTPGHSPGHCCFFEEDTNILYAGDYSPEEFGPWYGWPSCDLTFLVRSVQKIIDLEPDLLLSSHSEPVRDGVESELRDYLDVVRERDEEISKLVDDGFSVDEIVGEDIIYSEEAKSEPINVFFERVMISKHLEIDVEGLLQEE